MTTGSFFYPSTIKMVIHLKDTDNTTQGCMKECKLFWSQVSNSYHLLQIYGFVELQKGKGVNKYRLTEDGKKLRDNLCSAYYLINKNRQHLQSNIYGYSSKEEMIEDVKKDLVKD